MRPLVRRLSILVEQPIAVAVVAHLAATALDLMSEYGQGFFRVQWRGLAAGPWPEGKHGPGCGCSDGSDGCPVADVTQDAPPPTASRPLMDAKVRAGLSALAGGDAAAFDRAVRRDPAPGDASPPGADLDRNCVIIPHATEKPGPLQIDLHTAIMAVLQRPAYRDHADLRDPLDVITITRPGPTGPRYATIVRWYIAGDRPLEEMDLVDPTPNPMGPAALPRMDGAVRYVPAAKGAALDLWPLGPSPVAPSPDLLDSAALPEIEE